MSQLVRCDICGRELSDLNPIRLDWVKITTAKFSEQIPAARYDICTGCIDSVKDISDCIDNGEFPINDESHTNMIIVNRILKKTITRVPT